MSNVDTIKAKLFDLYYQRDFIKNKSEESLKDIELKTSILMNDLKIAIDEEKNKKEEIKNEP